MSYSGKLYRLEESRLTSRTSRFSFSKSSTAPFYTMAFGFYIFLLVEGCGWGREYGSSSGIEYAFPFFLLDSLLNRSCVFYDNQKLIISKMKLLYEQKKHSLGYKKDKGRMWGANIWVYG